MTIKTTASFFKGNWQTLVKTKVGPYSFPRKVMFFLEKSKRNSIIHLLKSAKKFDGEDSRAKFINGHKTIPSNSILDISKVYVHTCFCEDFGVDGFGVPNLWFLMRA